MMSYKEAENVYLEYANSFNNIGEGVFYPKSILKHTRAKIKVSLLAVAKQILITQGALPKEMGEDLEGKYGLLAHFFDDEDATTFNRIWNRLKELRESGANHIYSEEERNVFTLYARTLGNQLELGEEFGIFLRELIESDLQIEKG
jgi:hypothetical protein